MAQYDWRQLRAKAVRGFNNETPFEATEREIVEAFKANPQAVTNEVDRLVADIARGSDIRSAWAVLRRNVSATASAGPSVIVNDDSEREKWVGLAQRWMRNVGLLFDRWSEVDDELFGDRGCLRHWKDDPALRTHMRSLWDELRPLGEEVEADELERAKRWLASQTKVKEARKRSRAAESEEGRPGMSAEAERIIAKLGSPA